METKIPFQNEWEDDGFTSPEQFAKKLKKEFSFLEKYNNYIKQDTKRIKFNVAKEKEYLNKIIDSNEWFKKIISSNAKGKIEFLIIIYLFFKDSNVQLSK